ncbi:uncharacterized protein [Dermacentor albipictus]|uniref:uncharacterized protein isoform X3 n=1 Tax=Dermacentor albipictus TaxID=60249 RepID=UPI0031FDEF48
MTAMHGSLPLPPAAAVALHQQRLPPPPQLPPPPLRKARRKKKKPKAAKSEDAPKPTSSETPAPPSPPWPILDHRRRPGPNPVLIFSVAFVVIVALAVASFFQCESLVQGRDPRRTHHDHRTPYASVRPRSSNTSRSQRPKRATPDLEIAKHKVATLQQRRLSQTSSEQ